MHVVELNSFDDAAFRADFVFVCTQINIEFGGKVIHTQKVIDATQKETAIDKQQHSCETLVCQRHQTILRLLSSAATASTRWRVREIYCPTTYNIVPCCVEF